MTMQPQYYPQQAPPQQQFPAQPQYPMAPPAPQYPAQQQYPGQPAYGAPQPPPVQLANGSIDDYYSQPSAGGGPSISWKDQPNGATVVGIVARDVTDGDIQQDTDPKTGQPKTYRDGRPQFVMKVTLTVQPSPTFPDGEAALWVRGQMRDELVQAMGQAGVKGAPQKGAVLQVTLVERKPGRGAIPKNVYSVSYTPPNEAGAVAPSPAPAPVAQQAPVQPQAQPQQQFPAAQPQGQQVPAQFPQQVQQPQLPMQPQAAQVPQPAQQQFPQAAQAPAPAPAAQGPAQGAPQPPAGLTPEQQALLSTMTGQQQG